MILFDSSFLIAFYNERDNQHEKALDVWKRFEAKEWEQALLLEYVFLEVTTVIRSRRNLELASEVGELLLASSEIIFVSSSEYFMDTFLHFKAFKEASFSFTDVALIRAAKRHEVKHIATFDFDFRTIPELVVVPN